MPCNAAQRHLFSAANFRFFSRFNSPIVQNTNGSTNAVHKILLSHLYLYGPFHLYVHATLVRKVGRATYDMNPFFPSLSVSLYGFMRSSKLGFLCSSVCRPLDAAALPLAPAADEDEDDASAELLWTVFMVRSCSGWMPLP